MKKKILLISILFAFMLVGMLPINVFGATHTLEEIAEAFNQSNVVKDYGELLSIELSATTDEYEPNFLVISIMSEEGNSVVSYELNGNILGYEHLVDSNFITAILLADTIGQVNGYEYGELLDNFNEFTEEIYEYTVENDGFEIQENNSYYSVKMDITKKVPLIDESEFYLKPSDFDMIKKFIEEGVPGSQSGKKSKLAYTLFVGEEENEICIGEDDKLTESAYKSILSALEVMYSDKVVEYFEELYPEIDDGITTLGGITIENDFDVEEDSMFYNMPRILVRIDNEYIKERFLRTEYIGETVDCGKKTITLDFSKDEKYELSFFSTVKSSDVAFLFKNVIEPAFEESDVEAEIDDAGNGTAYCGFKDGKIVASNEENSIFKMVFDVQDYSIKLIATKPDAEKTTLSAKYEDIKSKEYKEDAIFEDMFRYAKYDLTVNIIYGKESYEVVEGANQTINVSKDEVLTVRLNIEYAKFKESGKVYVDDTIVDSSNYTSKEGSTIITFNSDYTKNLSDGEHTIKVAVLDGEANTSFKIEKAAKPSDYRKNPDTGRINIGFIKVVDALEYLK